MMSEHDVRHDRAGWVERPRLTCYSKDCPVKWGDTLVAQPWMSQGEWDLVVSDFMTKHPATTIRHADHGGHTLAYDPTSTSFTSLVERAEEATR
jgi:hypothetical protein